MYLSIGNDMAVLESAIVGIFDLDNCSYEKRTREFLKKAEKNGEIIPATDNLPKSFVLTSEYGLNKVYLVQFNSGHLQNRKLK
ncbi:MAG: DUF370 domain-containing protein [Oscillospiraceae bacterium]|nr:DUF370 domain-containing protein [Oscillospiraceae bacterium]